MPESLCAHPETHPSLHEAHVHQQAARACGRPGCQPRAPAASLPPLHTSTPDTWHNLQGHVCTNGKILPQKCTLITKAYKACVGHDLTPFPVISLFHWAPL